MKTVHSTVFLFINNLLKNKTPVESINNTTKAKSYFQKKDIDHYLKSGYSNNLGVSTLGVYFRGQL